MPISVKCSGCGKQYRLSEEAAGKKLRCRACGRDMMVPAAGDPSGETDPFEALVSMERNAAPSPPTRQRKPLISMPVDALPMKGESVRAPRRRSPSRFGRSKGATIGTDNLSPWAVILFVLLQILAAILQTVQARQVAGAAHGKTVGAIWTVAILDVGVLFLVLGPAVYLGMFITSKIFRFRPVDLGYFRGCGIAALPGLIVSGASLLPASVKVSLGDSLNPALTLLIVVAFFFALKYVFDLDWIGALTSYAFSGPLYAAALTLVANVVLGAVLGQIFGSGTVPSRNLFDRREFVQMPSVPATTPPAPNPNANSNNTGPTTEPVPDLEAKTAKTEDNLRQIGLAAQRFAATNDKNVFPPMLEALVSSGDLPAHCLNSPFQRPKPGGYFYWQGRSPAISGDVAVAYDAAELASQGGTHVLLANGNVEWQTASQFAALVRLSDQSVLDWQEDQRAKEKRKQEAMALPSANSRPTQPEQAPSVPKPQGFVALFNAQKSPFVASVTPIPLQGQISAVVAPLSPSPWAAVVRNNADTQDTVELWDLGAGQKKAEASFTHEAGAQQDYAISPDGEYLARIVQFPKLGVRVWSAKTAADLRGVVLNESLGKPTLAGFLNGEKFAIIWDRGTDEGLEIWDAASGQRARQVPFQPYHRTINNGLTSPDGREFACTSAHIPRGSPQVDFYNLYGVAGMRRWHEIADVDAADVDAPAGMAFSPDGKKMAALFAKQGAGFIICWRVADARPLGEYEVAVPAAGGAMGRGLDWVHNGAAWLVMGNTLIDPSSGKALGQLNAPPGARQWSMGGDGIALTYEEDGKTGIVVVKLNGSKFAAAAVTTAPGQK